MIIDGKVDHEKRDDYPYVISVAKELEATIFLFAQIGQPVPLAVLWVTDVLHSWSSPILHFHHIFLFDPIPTS